MRGNAACGWFRVPGSDSLQMPDIHKLSTESRPGHKPSEEESIFCSRTRSYFLPTTNCFLDVFGAHKTLFAKAEENKWALTARLFSVCWDSLDLVSSTHRNEPVRSEKQTTLVVNKIPKNGQKLHLSGTLNASGLVVAGDSATVNADARRAVQHLFPLLCALPAALRRAAAADEDDDPAAYRRFTDERLEQVSRGCEGRGVQTICIVCLSSVVPT